MPGKTKVVPIGFADCVQEFTLTGDPDPYLLTFGVSVATPPFTQQTAVFIRGAFFDHLLPLLTGEGNLGTFRATVPVDGGDPLLFESGGLNPGPGSNVPLAPPNVSLLVKKQTAFGGRRNRGRWYLPAIFIIDDSINSLGTIGNSAIQAALDNLLAAIEDVAAIGTMVILHSYEWDTPTDPGPPVGFPAPTPVTGLAHESLAATQRRRLR